MSAVTLPNGSLPRNFALNFGAQAIAITTAFLCVHPLIQKLGYEAFGLLTLLWSLVGYFSFLDLGISQALIKHVSESLANSEREKAAALIQRAMRLTFLMGMGGSLVVVIFAFIGIENFLAFDPHMKEDVRTIVLILATGLPATMLVGSLRGVPMAFNRFAALSLAQAVAGVIQWGGAVVVALLGGGLLGVVIITILSRYFLLSVCFFLTYRLIPEVFHRKRPLGRDDSIRFLRFGGWVSVSQMIAPLLTFIERFVLGAMISVGSIPFFAVPSEVVVRLLIIPMSIVNALFPFMSRSWILDDGKKVVNLIYQRCVKYLYLTVVPIVFVLTIFSGEILKIWLGIEFMEKSSLILSVLAAGYLFNSLSQIPFVALQALGRPDLPAKISLLQVPVYTGLFVALTAGWGLIGSAIAWLVRVSCESFFLFFFARRIMHAKANPADLSYIWKASILFAAGGLFIFAAQVHSLRVEWQVGLLLVIGGLYAVGLWLFALDEKDKDFVQRHTLGFLR